MSTTTAAPDTHTTPSTPRRSSRLLAYAPILTTLAVVILVGDMRTAAAVIVAVAVATMTALTFGRRPVTAAAAGVASAAVAIGLGAFETAATRSGGPLVDAALFTVMACVALTLAADK